MLAYGLNVPAIGRSNALTGTSARDWRCVSLVQFHADAPLDTSFQIGEDLATLRAGAVAVVTVRRRPLSVEVAAPGDLGQEALVHPILSFAGAVAARWSGRSAFHAASVVVEGRAWILMAGPAGGKSTLVTALDQRGHPVLADDLTVIDDGWALAGPRTCDLRFETADRLHRGVLLEREVGRPRWRTELAPAPHEAPLGGFIALRWADSWSLEPVDAGERLALLSLHEALLQGPSRPLSFLDLLPLPMVVVRRPRHWRSLDRAVATVESIASRP